MKRSIFPSLEPLEARIAPAATIAVSLVGGHLTLTSDANDTELTIFNGPNGTFRLWSPNNNFDFADNSLDVVGQTFVKVTGDITVNFAGTNDALIVNDVKLLKNLTVNLGNGNNGVSLTDTSIKGDLTINGGANNDALSFGGTKVTIGGQALFNLGDGTNSINGGVNTLSVGKNLTYTGGTGMDNINLLGGGLMEVKGAVAIDLGAGGSSNINLSPVIMKIAQSLTVKGGAGSDTVTMQAGNVKIGKDLVLDLAGERNNIGILTADSFSVGGAVSMLHGDNPSMNKGFSQIISNGKLTVGKGVTVEQGNGYFDTTIRGTVTSIGGAVNITQGDHDDNTTNFLTLAGLTSLTTKGGVTIDNGDGYHAVNINGGSLLSIGGKTSVTHGNHTMGTLNVTIHSSFATDLKGDVTVTGGNGDTYTSIKATDKLNILGNVLVSNANGGDILSVTGYTTNVKGSVTFEPGSGFSSETITAAGKLTVGGNIRYAPAMGDNSSLGVNVGSGSVGGNIAISTPTTMLSNHSIYAKYAPLTVKKGFFLDSEGGAGDVVLQMSNLNILGETLFNGGSEATSLMIDDTTFGGRFTADLKDGADVINIEKNFTVPARQTVFANDVNILLGDTDNDLLSIGNSASPTYHAVFKKKATFDGGAGMNDGLVLSSASFAVAGQPVSTGF